MYHGLKRPKNWFVGPIICQPVRSGAGTCGRGLVFVDFKVKVPIVNWATASFSNERIV